MMDENAKEARRIYVREWQRANKDKVRAAQARYWKKKAAKIRQAESEVNENDQQRSI